MPWCDQACGDARLARQAVHDCPHSTDEQRCVAEKQYKSVISRSKKRWMQERNDELVAAAEEDPSRFWKAFKAVQHNALWS